MPANGIPLTAPPSHRLRRLGRRSEGDRGGRKADRPTTRPGRNGHRGERHDGRRSGTPGGRRRSARAHRWPPGAAARRREGGQAGVDDHHRRRGFRGRRDRGGCARTVGPRRCAPEKRLHRPRALQPSAGPRRPFADAPRPDRAGPDLSRRLGQLGARDPDGRASRSGPGVPARRKAARRPTRSRRTPGAER